MGEVCSSLTCKEKGLNHTFWTKSVRENDEGSASVRCLNPTTLDAIYVPEQLQTKSKPKVWPLERLFKGRILRLTRFCGGGGGVARE